MKPTEVGHLVKFLIYLNEKGLITDYDFEYEKEAKKYLKKIKIKS